MLFSITDHGVTNSAFGTATWVEVFQFPNDGCPSFVVGIDGMVANVFFRCSSVWMVIPAKTIK
jgi:hypothetical protein